ncbi:RHS domain-containing protein [Salmonella enterica]|nr:RHS domain-containing protein [Salmonella enterica]
MNMPPEGGEHPAKVRGDRLLLQGDHHYEYDEFGNLIADRWGKAQCREHRFEWNCEHRLVRFTDVRHYDDEGFPRHTLTHSWRYEYDAFGRRIRKTDEETGKATLFFWQDDRMVTECDEAHADFSPDTVLNRHTKATDFDCTSYLYEPGGSFRPLAQLKGRGVGSTVSYYVNDQIGTPQELLDEDDNVVWSAIYRAYGHAEMQAGIRQPLCFQGQYADEESGLHYNRYRYYNPLSGRYLTPDPISIRGGINTYAYVPDPLGWVDPLGLNGCPDEKPSNDGPLLPDEAWHKNAPNQVTPGTKELEHYKYNPKTGELEYSTVKYDEYGRQVERIDYTDHGYGDPSSPDYHSNPHIHTHEYAREYSFKGKEIRINLDFSGD